MILHISLVYNGVKMLKHYHCLYLTCIFVKDYFLTLKELQAMVVGKWLALELSCKQCFILTLRS